LRTSSLKVDRFTSNQGQHDHWSILASATLCIVAKWCVLEQKLLLRAYRKSYMNSRLVPKLMTLTFI